MHLKYEFEIMNLDEQVIAVPIGDGSDSFNAVIRLNRTGAEIFELFRDETTEDAVVATMLGRYSEDTLVESDIRTFIADLAAQGVLV